MPIEKKTISKSAGISSDAVKLKTGKTWEAWYKILDKINAKTIPHKEIAKILNKQYGLSPWWSQMVTVGYEQERGNRVKHQTSNGFQISVSRTMAASGKKIYEFWNDSTKRNRWLEESITIRKATPYKSLRITWSDAKSSLEINIYPKGETKSQLVVQHNKLTNAREAARMKTFWKTTLERLTVII